jgi:hypothetical protein
MGADGNMPRWDCCGEVVGITGWRLKGRENVGVEFGGYYDGADSREIPLFA